MRNSAPSAQQCSLCSNSTKQNRKTILLKFWSTKAQQKLSCLQFILSRDLSWLTAKLFYERNIKLVAYQFFHCCFCPPPNSNLSRKTQKTRLRLFSLKCYFAKGKTPKHKCCVFFVLKKEGAVYSWLRLDYYTLDCPQAFSSLA